MGKNKLYDVRQITDLRELVNGSASLYPKNNAFLIRKKDKSYKGITYTRLVNDINALGTVLLNLGLKDEHIAVIGENRYEWCVSYLSIVSGVGVVVPIDKELHKDDIMNLLTLSKSKAVIFSGKLSKTFKEIASEITSIKYYICMDNTNDEAFITFKSLQKKGKELLEKGETSYINAEIDSEKMSILLYTSGTTGNAKGVMLSHRNICSNIMAVCKTVKFSDKDSVLSILPIHHTYECTCGFLTILYNGGCIAFCEGLKYIGEQIKETSPTILIVVPLLLENVYKKIVEQIEKSKITKTAFKTLVGVNSLLKVLKADCSKKFFKKIHKNLGGRLRLIITGAAAIDPSVSKGLEQMGFEVLQGYGLTECSPLVAGNSDFVNRYDSVGVAMPGVEIKIENTDEHGIGEIVVKGPNVMLGYYENESATEKCLKNGWFYTGDLGCMDAKGRLSLTGRLKNVIVTKNGKNIYPEEVEGYVNKSPFVLESIVWGFYDKDSGETFVSAQIVPNLEKIKEMFMGAIPTKEQINNIMSDVIKTVNKNMPLYKNIKNFSIRENEFVKTTTKKIKRYIEDFENQDMNPKPIK